MKTVKVEGGSCIEDVNIRNAAVNFPRQGILGARRESARNAQSSVPDASLLQRETFDIEDVAWSNGRYSQQIATAAASGKIVLYDLDRPGIEVGRLHEHNRQVHKVDFCPLEGQYLLSASQDGTVRLWDLRTFRHVMKCESKDTFPGRSDGVRHTKWSPTSSASFALGTDNGTVQRWDIRQNRTPTLKISAHSNTCNSIDWHPDGRHLISAGKDQDVKVWDLRGERRQKPAFQLRAPKPIQNVRWRPPCYVADGPDQLVKQCTHLATSYKRYPMVHVWDLRRPSIPFREYRHEVNEGTTDMMWHSVDLLWTVGLAGEFNQSDVRYLPRTLDHRTLSSFSSSNDGELTLFSQPRAGRRPSSVPQDDIGHAVSRQILTRRRSKSPNSWGSKLAKGDDSLDENFLSTSFPRRGHSRSSSFKSAKSLGSTPPSYEDFGRPVTDLDETMRRLEVMPPSQRAHWGNLSFAALNPIHTVVARKLKTIRASNSTSLPRLMEALEIVFTSQMRRIARTGDIMTSQALALEKSLIEENFWDIEQKFGSLMNDSIPISRPPLQDIAKSGTLSKAASPSTHVNGRSISNALSPRGTKIRTAPGSPADAVTPLARPQPDFNHVTPQLGTPPLDLNFGSLDPSPVQVRSAVTRHETNESAETSTSSPSPGAEFAHNLLESPERDARRESPRDYKQPARAPLKPENSHHASQGRSIPPPPPRHNSSESFQMFSTSSDSQKLLSAHGSFASGIEQNKGRSRSTSPDTRLAKQVKAAWIAPMAQSRHSNSSGVLESLPELSRSALGSSQSNSEDAQHTERTRPGDENGAPSENGIRGARDDRGRIVNNAEIHKHEHGSAAAREADTSSQQLEKSQSTIADQPIPDTRSVPVAERSPDQGGDTAHAISVAMQSLQDIFLHHAMCGEAQAASSLFVSVAPLLTCLSNLIQSTTPSRSEQTTHSDQGILLISQHGATSSYLETFQSLFSLTPISAQAIVDTCHRPLEIAANLSPTFVESFMSTYHEQLLSLQLHSEAALIRKLSFPAFPAVFEQGLVDIDIELCCVECGDAVDSTGEKARCTSCNTTQPDCAICWQDVSPFSLTEPLQPKSQNKRKISRQHIRNSPTQNDGGNAAVARDASTTSLFPNYLDGINNEIEASRSTMMYTSCSLCAHTLHAACALIWFSDVENEGMCPIDGCLCPCTPGSRRDELDAREQAAATRQAAISRARRGGSLGTVEEAVRRDDWEVGESKAVRRVVGALREHGGGVMSDGERSPQRSRAVSFERRRSESVEGRARHSSEQERRQSEDAVGIASTNSVGWNKKGAFVAMGFRGAWSGS